MATALFSECEQTETGALERVNYFPRQLLTADEMVRDQDYFRAKLRRHNRFLHGWGVVCGLEVTPLPGPNLPWQVQIGGGYALGPFGDEIYLANPVLLDLAKCGPGAETDPCDPGALLKDGQASTGATLFIAIRYEECYSRPVRVMPGGCGCDEASCEPSRIRDSFQIECLDTLPPSHQQGATSSICDLLTGRALPPCLPCPTDPWVVLARITLPGASGSSITAQQIDNFLRRQVFSTTAIQDQVIRCCCTARDRQPARVTSINPAPGARFSSASTVPRSIVGTFSKNIRPDTVTPTAFMLTASLGGAIIQIPGAVSYDDVNRAAQFTPNEPLTRPGTYQISIVGSGPGPITDIDDLALDGNDDGQAGGNFLSQFIIGESGPAPTRTPPTPTPAPTSIRTFGVDPVTVKSAQVQSQAISDINLEIGDIGSTAVQGTISVFVNAPLPTQPDDTAVLIDNRTGAQVAIATKGPNTFTFANVAIETGSSWRIDKMRVVQAPVGPIIAQVSVTAPPITFTVVPPVFVATGV